MSLDPGLIGPSLTADSNNPTSSAPDDGFAGIVVQALISEGIDPFSMNPDQVYALVSQLWQDRRLQDEFGLFNGDTALGSLDVTVTSADVRDAIRNELFSTSQSGNSSLLQQGLNLRQSQGLPLSTAQADFLATGAMGGTTGSSGTIADLARRAGWSEDLIPTITAIVMAESGGNPDAVGDLNLTPGGSVGLAQINLQAHPDLAQKYDLTDPLQNLKAALEVYQNAGNSFTPWTTYNTGAYQQFLGAGTGPFVRGGATTTAKNLETQYSGLASTFNSFIGRKPTPQELMDLIGMTPDQLTQYLRSWNSHIPGLTIGGYEDLRTTADRESNSLLGHGVTDGMISELAKQGIMSASQINLWLLNMDAQGKMDPKTYQQIWQANQPHMAAIYNQGANFDQRIANQQHGAAKEAGVLPEPDQATLQRAWSDYRRQLAASQDSMPAPGPAVSTQDASQGGGGGEEFSPE